LLEQYIFFNIISWWLIVYLLVVFFLSNITGVLSAFTLAQGKTSTYVVSNIGGATLFALIVLVMWFFDKTHYVYWVLPISYVASGVFLVGAFDGKIKFDLRALIESGRFYSIFRFCLTVYIGLVSLPIVSIFIRESFQSSFGAVELSYWQVAVKISDTIQQFYGMFCAVLLLPFLARKMGTMTLYTWSKCLLGISALYLIGATVIFLCRGYVIDALFGMGYQPAAMYFKYYLIGDYFRAAALFCSYTMISVDKFGKALLFEVLQGGVFLAVFYSVFSDHGSTGAGLTYLVTYLFCFVVMLGFVVSYFKGRSE
jgi:O-antigen/teichoic acid export membrane protein